MIYEGDAALLEKLPPRKEMRRTRDLVRLSSERVDDRTLALDAPWFSTDGVSDSDVDEDEDDASELGSDAKAEENGSGVVGGDSEEDAAADDAGLGVVESDETEEDEVLLQSFSARKRKRPQPPPSSLAPSSKSQSGPTRPRKKVAFATTSVEATTNSTRPSTASSKEHTLSKTRPLPYKRSNVKAKAPAETKPPPPPPRTRKSAANAPPPTSQKRKPDAGGGEDGTYDFSKFF
jgi:hypothetical protein